MTERAAEAVVRRFLQALEDPSVLVDQIRVAELSDKLAAATDPLDELTLTLELEHARTGDLTAVREGFIATAKAYVTDAFPGEEDRVVSWFADKGIDAGTLAAAGFKVGRSRDRGAARVTGSRVPSSQVVATLVNAPKPLTLTELAALSGASPGTVRKAVAELTGAGRLVEAGRVPGWTTRGKAPMRYSAVPVPAAPATGKPAPKKAPSKVVPKKAPSKAAPKKTPSKKAPSKAVSKKAPAKRAAATKKAVAAPNAAVS